MNATASSVLAHALCDRHGCAAMLRDAGALPCEAHRIEAEALVSYARARGYLWSALPVVSVPLRARVSGEHANR